MMMLRERLQSFLVAALIVSVTSESSRNCSICGDGYEVGSPYVRTSLSCSDPVQGSSATFCTCKDLEIAGLQGWISECSIVSLVIFEACHCQKNTSQNTWFPTYSPSFAPFAPVAPVAPTNYPSSFRPTPQAPGSTPAGDSSTLFNIIFTSIFLGIPCFCFCLMPCLTNLCPGACRRWCVCHAPSRYSEGTVTQQHLPTPSAPIYHAEGTRHHLPTIPVSTPTLSIGNPRSRRPLVLEALFPKEGREGDGSPQAGRFNLAYDPQSKHYVFCENAPDAVSCSICMDFLVSTDDTVTGLCSHSYHRECIMNWLRGDHDECPNCRQPMWDPETYAMIDQCINNQEWQSLSAV